MARSRFLRVFALAVILLTATAVGAQPSPRVVPSNDDFNTPKALPIGGSVKILDPAAATEEGSEPNPCGNAPHNSVWFTFTPVTYGTLVLSTAGTRLIDPLHNSESTVLAVYTGAALGSLTPGVCATHTAGSLNDLIFGFVPGITYHIQLTSLYDLAYASQSFFKLTTRLINLSILPENYDFESPLSTANWKLKNGTTDEIVCNDISYPAYIGLCAFKFTGGGGESSKLVQTMNVPPGYPLRKNGLLAVWVVFRGMDTATVENAKITATLAYSDGTPTQKVVINLSGAPAASYDFVNGIATLASAKLSKVKLQISHKSTVGVLLLDSFSIGYSTGTITRDASVLPVLSAPK